LAAEVGDELSEQHWADVDIEDLNAKLDTNTASQAFLRQSDMSELFQRPEFELSTDGESESFKGFVEQALPTPLAIDLIANGYINRNFTLYVSQYYAVHVSLDAMNYLVHHVYTNDPDTTLALPPDDVEAVIREAGVSVLNDRSMYNVSIVDHLLSQHDSRAKRIAHNLVQWGQEEREFVGAYVSDGKHARQLYRVLSKSWSHAFLSVDDLGTDVDIDDATRVSLFDGALQGAAVATAYDVTSGIAAFIADHYSEMEAVTEPPDASAASTVVRILDRFGVILPALLHLDERVRQGVISGHRYVLTAENLTNALDGVRDYALDTINGKDLDVYEYVLDNLGTYKAIVDSAPTAQYTVKSKAGLIRVLQDVQAKAPPMVFYIASHGAPECRVDVLTDAPEDVWPAVIDAQRFAVTFRNVAAYTDIYGIDEHLAAALITAGVIDTDVADDESDRRAWASDAINAYEAIGDPAVRVNLVASLKLVEPLAVSEIQPQDGPLYGLLLQEELLADTAEVYSAVAHVGAVSRESLIPHIS
jgi:hypothetical protein